LHKSKGLSYTRKLVHQLPTPDKILQQLTSDTAYHMVILTFLLQAKQFHSDLERTQLRCPT